VSAVAGGLVPLLARGASLAELADHLREARPAARNVERRLAAFVASLEAGGLLDGREATDAPAPRRRRSRRIRLGNPDRIAARLAGALMRIPRPARRWLSWALVLASCTGIALVELGMLWPHAGTGGIGFDPFAVAALLLVVVPLHELAHAVACRAAGAPVSEAGIAIHGGLIPGPYVDTSLAYRVADRWRRFWIPAAGPLIDLIAAGAAAWVVVWTGGAGAVGHAAGFLLVLCLFFLFFDTTPLTASDGSRMLEAGLDDELARRSALIGRRARALSPPPVVAVYRLAGAMHTAVGILLLNWFAS
jgi:putative peptide zinc metalloprotease protein